jgi:hypothetical protein
MLQCREAPLCEREASIQFPKQLDKENESQGFGQKNLRQV